MTYIVSVPTASGAWRPLGLSGQPPITHNSYEHAAHHVGYLRARAQMLGINPPEYRISEYTEVTP